MLEVYTGSEAPPQSKSLVLKPKLRSWTGRVWRWHPTGYQLMLKLEVAHALSEVVTTALRASLPPSAAELASFPL